MFRSNNNNRWDTKENEYIKTLNVDSNEIIYLNNGSAVNFKTSLTPKEIVEKLGATILSKQTLKNENLEIFYCFVENISNFVVENGKKINLQIANNGNFSIHLPLKKDATQKRIAPKKFK